MRRHFLAFLVTFAVGFPAESPAEDTVKLPEEYRTIVCDAAVDMDSPLHGLALRVVEKQQFNDPKFDDFIRQTLSSENSGGLGVTREIETVQRLMPFCTIPNDERVRLLLDQIEASRDTIASMTVNRSGKIDLTVDSLGQTRVVCLAKLAQHHQKELLAELKKRLDVDHPHWILVSAVNLLRIDGQELLPMLMKAAKSDDFELQFAAIDAVNQLLLPQSDADLDPRARQRRNNVIRLAEGMMRRYDNDNDKRLDASEWMLMPQPVGEADSDGDGFVTAEEYGRWIELRSSRRP